MCPDRIFHDQREFALRVRSDDSRVGDVEIRREMLDKTTCPVPVPCPVPALTGNRVRSRAHSASPKRTRVQRSPWSTRAGLLLSLEGRASQPAAKHVAIFIQPQNGDLNKIDFPRRRSRARFSERAETRRRNSASIVRSPERGDTPLATRRKPVDLGPARVTEAPEWGLKREELVRIPPAHAGGKQSVAPLGVNTRISGQSHSKPRA
jgi:hypothetical protein